MQFWCVSVVNNLCGHSTSVMGLTLLGENDIWISASGSVLSGLFLYGGYSFARNTVRTCYQSADGERIGFELCNGLGFNGRTIEAPIGNVDSIDGELLPFVLNTEKLNILPINVIGLAENLLICDRRQFLASDVSIQLLSTGRDKHPVTTTATTAQDTKEKITTDTLPQERKRHKRYHRAKIRAI